MSESYIPLLHINAVSYEGSLFGINVDVNAASDEIIRTEMAFGFHETPGSLKALAISSQGRYMICAGMDEYIRIFDLQKKRSMGEMSGHTGCVTALSFIGEKFVISASEDGTMIIWRVNGWQKLHILGGHKGPVNDLALHPSGKLCLSVSRDNTLKIWNLVHGRCAFTRRLKGFASKVEWHQESDFYFLVVNNEVQIYNSADNNECTATIVCTARVNQARFVDIGAAHQQASEPGVYVCVVCEDSSMHFFTEKGVRVGTAYDLTAAVHGSRPKDMWCCTPSADPSRADADFGEYMDGEGHVITVISSAGDVVVYSARRLCEGDGEEEEDGDEEEEEEEEEDDGDGDGGDNGKEKGSKVDGTAFACLARYSIPSEPRLTAVVAYDPCAAANPSSKQAKRAQDDEALELATEVEEVVEKARSGRGGSKRKKEQEQVPAAVVSSKGSDKKKKKAGKKE